MIINFSTCFVVVIRTILSTVIADSGEKWIWLNQAPDLLESSDAKISVAKPIVYRHRPGTKRKIEGFPVEYFENDHNDDEPYRARYEVQELNEQYSGGRPIAAIVSRRPYSKRTKPSLAPLIINADEHSYQSSGNNPIPSRQQSLGILTGPVPSWEKPSLHKNGDPTHFELCKCSFSFNCKSPGIHFGSCDQGKMYCCYNEFGLGKVTDSNGDGSKKVERVVINPWNKASNGNREPKEQ